MKVQVIGGLDSALPRVEVDPDAVTLVEKITELPLEPDGAAGLFRSLLSALVRHPGWIWVEEHASHGTLTLEAHVAASDLVSLSNPSILRMLERMVVRYGKLPPGGIALSIVGEQRRTELGQEAKAGAPR